MDEIWKDINSYEGIYQISNYGRIRSLTRYVNCSPDNSFGHILKGKILKQGDNGNGYKYISLKKNGKRKNFYVHFLVAEAFIGERPRGADINHIDCNKSNNTLKNLEYISRQENINHAVKNGLLKNRNHAKGEKQGSAKLNNQKVILIRAFFNFGVSNKKLSEIFKIHKATVSNVVLRQTWKHL